MFTIQSLLQPTLFYQNLLSESIKKHNWTKLQLLCTVFGRIPTFLSQVSTRYAHWFTWLYPVGSPDPTPLGHLTLTMGNSFATQKWFRPFQPSHQKRKMQKTGVMWPETPLYPV